MVTTKERTCYSKRSNSRGLPRSWRMALSDSESHAQALRDQELQSRIQFSTVTPGMRS
jgi:hypothetical protein